MVGHLAGGGEIRDPSRPTAKECSWGHQASLLPSFHPAGGIELGDGGDDGRIQTTGEQHAIGHVASAGA